MKITVKRLVTIALLVSVALILRKIITIPLPIGVLSFGGFPIIFAGLLLGPSGGALVGGISDIMGCMLFPRGPYIPWFTITSMLTGALPPLVVLLMRMRHNAPVWAIFTAIAVAQILTKWMLFPLIMKISFGIPYLYTLYKGLIVELIHIPIYTFLARGILLTQNESYVTPARLSVLNFEKEGKEL